MTKNMHQLMLVTNKGTSPLEQYLKFIQICANAGITSVQLREKNLTNEALFEFGQKLLTILKPLNIPLIINDNLRLALELNADGLHLGQTDGNIFEARKALGTNKILGLSVDSMEQLENCANFPIDYIGIGAIYKTKNKPNINKIWGCEGLAKVRALTTHKIVAIGGIGLKEAKQVLQVGADGIAAIGLFHDAINPKKTIQELCKSIREKND